jgi:riboflavin synthase
VNAPHNNEMNLTNRGVPGMKERPASGEPVLAEVGRPVILSLGVAGYFSVLRTLGETT